jgi:dCMP deaminase
MKVGCLIVKDDMIISDGYNGTPSGFDNTCEGEDGKTLKEVLHAESNAITKLAKSTQSSYNATAYITLSPCIDCAKLMIQSGISRVVYGERYRLCHQGLDLLTRAGIPTILIS